MGLTLPSRKMLSLPDRAFRQVHPVVYDMHFGILRGRGWQTGEVGGNVDYTLATGASVGDTSILLTGPSAKPIAGQIIALLGTDGQYYSAQVSGISSNTVSLAAPLEIGVSAGAYAHNFYINESHPNFWGYQAIADDLIRAPRNHWLKVHQESPNIYAGSATVAAFTTDNSANPGSSAGGGWAVTPTSGGGGCKWEMFRPGRTGSYRAVLRCNRGAVATTAPTFNILINGGYQYSKTITSAGVENVVLDFEVTDTDAVEFRLLKTDLSAMYVGDLVILQRQGRSFDGFDTGRHYVFGDSWAGINTEIGQGIGILDRLRERFPRATFINKGVGGNTAAMMAARFDADIAADVAANGPACSMLIIAGTNDYFGSVTPTTHAIGLGQCIAKAKALGITPIVFTSSVGSYTESTARFALSRRYATEVAYHEREMGWFETWLPRLDGTGTTGVGTYTQQIGYIRRAGNRRDFVANLAWTNHTGTTGMKITGLPEAAFGASYPVSVAYSNLTYSSQVQGYVAGSEIFLGQAGTGSSLAALAMDTAATLYVSGSYFV